MTPTTIQRYAPIVPGISTTWLRTLGSPPNRARHSHSERIIGRGVLDASSVTKGRPKAGWTANISKKEADTAVVFSFHSVVAGLPCAKGNSSRTLAVRLNVLADVPSAMARLA